MSRNKIIKMVHEYTGKSYKACRAFCKYHHWNETKIESIIFCIDADTLEDLTKAFDGISKAIFEAGAKIAAGLAALCDNMGAAFRDQSERMQKLAAPFDVNKDYFNFDNVNISEVKPPLTAHVGNVSFPIELEPPDVNDPHTPVFAPYYASAAGNGKLYQNDGERNTDETGA